MTDYDMHDLMRDQLTAIYVALRLLINTRALLSECSG
jgi:hypothetical protein